MKNLIIHVPHSSITVPPEYLPDFDKEKLDSEILLMTDWFCDELFKTELEHFLLKAEVSRLVCDVERFRNDADETMSHVGMGAVYTSCSDLAPLRSVSPEKKEKILRRYYDKHHLRFTHAVEYCLKEYGKCVIIDGHSFFPTPLPYEPDKSPDRPDFCIGTSDFHTPPKLARMLKEKLQRAGYSVKLNEPYSGTIVPMRFYNNDSRVISVMIEINRELYMDTPGVKNKHFTEIQKLLSECISLLETF